MTDHEITLKRIAKELCGIDICECTLCESNIAEILVEAGFMKVKDRGEEVFGWQEYEAKKS